MIVIIIISSSSLGDLECIYSDLNSVSSPLVYKKVKTVGLELRPPNPKPQFFLYY